MYVLEQRLYLYVVVMLLFLMGLVLDAKLIVDKFWRGLFIIIII